MNPKILNREGKLPDDGFYQIEAVGEHVNHEARVVQVIDAKAVETIVNRFNTEADQAEFSGLRVDKDHLSQSMENPTEALGWCMRLRNRGGVPEAKIDWTALGLPLVESKPGQPPVYKFFSTEYVPAECEPLGTRVINRERYAVIRPLRIDGLSLTNDPNNKGQRPISNRQPASAATAPTTTTTMKQINALLGLAEDAQETSAVAEIQKIKNRATAAETEVTTLKTERDALLADQVEADLTKYAGVIKNRDTVRAQLLANRKGTLELLASLNAPEETPETGADKGGYRPIHNRRDAKQPGSATEADKKQQAEEARAARISNRARQLCAGDKSLSLTQAYANAAAEIEAEAAK